MFDVFYFSNGSKPNLFAHEREADSVEHAQKLSRTRFFWIVHYLADYSDWNFLWEPVPWQSKFVHAWPNQWHDHSGTYLVPRTGAVNNYHFHTQVIPNRPHTKPYKFLVKDVEFDTSWAPHPHDPPYNYVFGNQWWPGTTMPTVEYRVPGATQTKYMDTPQAQLPKKHSSRWHTLVDCEWDYSWQPDPGDPPYRYVFGNQWHSAEVMPTMEWLHPAATEDTPIKHVDWPRAQLVPMSTLWHIPDDIDPESVDMSWCPDPGSPPYIYQFGTQHQRTGGPVYTVPGATEVKYVSHPRAVKTSVDSNWTVPEGVDTSSFDWTWHPDATDGSYIYQFGTQWQRTGGPVYTMLGATEVKYVSHPRAVKTSVDRNWTVPEGVDTSSFDWTWHPDATDGSYIYQFGTQHQRTGGPVYTVPGATEVKYVEQIKIKTDSKSAVIVEVDHLDGNAGKVPNSVKTIRYFDNYRDTLIRLAKSLVGKHEFVWVCSSICDYEGFDFSWHPEQWQATMLHVFASNDQKFGDTFYMHVPTFAERAEKKALLEWYDVNFVEVRVPRRNMPVILHNNDSQVDAVKNTEWAGPLATFTNHDYVTGNLATISLWREETKTIVPVSNGAGTVVVPRTAVPYIKTQLYDYPYIDKTQRILTDTPLDIVFISNGEINAEVYLEHLKWTVVSDYKNHIHHVSGVNGRVAAYQEAARQSHTPWFFAVFAKLEVNSNFDWTWQPDRMQQPKHYIFHAYNPVNGLVYGHQAMIAYNKKLVLENTGEGLDFTLDQAHEVVPIVSGTANYHESAWMCWRTAFREVLKLRASLPDVESEHRLNRWLTVDTTPEQWSRKGAEDGVEYYDSVGGNFAELKKSYEWSWLATYAFMKRNLVVN